MAAELRQNVTFQQRYLNIFDQADKDHDGVVTMSEVMLYAETCKQMTNRPDHEIEPLREVLREFFEEQGVTEEGCKREDWLDNLSVFVTKELERLEKGVPTLSQKVLDTFFGLIDLNDDKTLSPDEFAIFAKVFEWPEAIVAPFFKFADVNKNGKLEWNEFYDAVIRFWYKVEEGDIDNLYGGHF